MGAVITHEGDRSKVVISGAALLPVAVALDPDLMLGCPRRSRRPRAWTP